MPETLYLTVNLIDRYLAKRNVTRKRLQLVRQGPHAATHRAGAGCLLAAHTRALAVQRPLDTLAATPCLPC